MRIDLTDGRAVDVAFKYENGNNDPRIKAIKEQRDILFNSNVSLSGKIDADTDEGQEIIDTLARLDAAIGALRKGKQAKITCEITVLLAETIEQTATTTVKFDDRGRCTCRREALDRCLKRIWAVSVQENRPFRKQVWMGLLCRRFNVV